MTYLAIKHLHVTCVILSGLGFALRGFWMLRAPERLQLAWVRIAPHIVDSTLLGSAIALAWLSARSPFVQAWLSAKLAGLLVYIMFGSLALKRARTRRQRKLFLALALLAYAYIVSVALTRQPVPWG